MKKDIYIHCAFNSIVVAVLRSDGPDLDLLRNDAPVGVVVVRRDYVQVLYILLD